MNNKLFSEKNSLRSRIDIIKRRPGISLAVAYFISLLIFCFIVYKYKTNLSSNFDDFTISFAASLLEDLLFFLFIGIVLFIITIKKPEDNDIDVRLDTVISSQNVTAQAKNHFRSETKSVLAFYERCDVSIEIHEFDEALQAYKLFFIFDAVITNMCQDIPFQLMTYAFTTPGVEKDGQLGEIIALYIKDSNSGEQVGETVGSLKKLGKKGYIKKVPLEISANGKAEYKFAFWIWSEIGHKDKPFYTAVDRFTDTYNLSVKNKLTNDLILPFSADLNHKDEPYKLIKKPLLQCAKVKSGERKKIMENDSLKPGESIDIFFLKPENIHNNQEERKKNV
jgi:hypothetical protein